MDPVLIRALQDLQPEIRARWKTLLRRELPNTPLADPAILVRLFDVTLSEVFGVLGGEPRSLGGEVSSSPGLKDICSCGRNPLIAYFLTGERAFLQAMVSAEQSAGVKLGTATTEVYCVLRQIARREIAAFCSLCQYRQAGAGNFPNTRQLSGFGQREIFHPATIAVHSNQS